MLLTKFQQPFIITHREAMDGKNTMQNNKVHITILQHIMLTGEFKKFQLRSRTRVSIFCTLSQYSV